MGRRYFSPNQLGVLLDKRKAYKEWRSIDLARHKLFNDDDEPPPPAPATDDMTIQRATLLPLLAYDFLTSNRFPAYLDFFPLAGRKLLAAFRSGRLYLDSGLDLSFGMTLSNLLSPKRSPFALLVPSRFPTPEPTMFDGNFGIQAILVMERSPVQEPAAGAGDESHHQFEAIFHCSQSRSWLHVPLPAPPFVYDPKYYVDGRRPSISSYAVVPGPYRISPAADSHLVCISVDGAGTYCFDTVSHVWTKVGDWNMPFIGRVDYVRELNLWFGICPNYNNNKKGFHLGAADLSTMTTVCWHPCRPQQQLPLELPQPHLVGTWKQELTLTDDATTKAAGCSWKEVRRPQLVNLGSGRFCIARFFSQRRSRVVMEMEEPTRLTFDDDNGGRIKLVTTVLTGVDVKKRHTSSSLTTTMTICSSSR